MFQNFSLLSKLAALANLPYVFLPLPALSVVSQWGKTFQRTSKSAENIYWPISEVSQTRVCQPQGGLIIAICVSNRHVPGIF